MTPTTLRQSWLEWRLGGIGSSDVAAAHTGIYGGAYRAVAQRIGLSDVDDIDPALAERGQAWEHAIADGVHAHTGYYVGGEQLWLEHPTNGRWRCTPDGLLFTSATPAGIGEAVAGLEIKTRGSHGPWQWEYWNAQCQFAMVVADLPRWLLAIATIGAEFDPTSGQLTPEFVTDVRYRMLYADPVLQTSLVETADWLLEHVDRGTLPDPVDPEALPYVKAANAAADPSVAADIDDLADLIARYEQLRVAAKQAEDERRTAEARIRARMGPATEARTSDGAWRVRVGNPVAQFTAQSEIDFIELYCTHRPHCGPGCVDHHPDLLVPTLDRSRAKTVLPDHYAALRIPTPDRRLTIKHLEED